MGNLIYMGLFCIYRQVWIGQLSVGVHSNCGAVGRVFRFFLGDLLRMALLETSKANRDSPGFGLIKRMFSRLLCFGAGFLARRVPREARLAVA